MISQSHRQEVLHHGFSIGGRLRISTLSNCFPSTSSKNSTTRVVWQVSILCIFLIVYPKANKCNQYDYASSQAGNLRTYLKTHTGEKANKCNQYDYAFTQAGHLRTNGERPNKCKQCNGFFLHLFRQAIWRHIWKRTVKKSRTNATLPLFLYRQFRTHLKIHTGEKSKKFKQVI